MGSTPGYPGYNCRMHPKPSATALLGSTQMAGTAPESAPFYIPILDLSTPKSSKFSLALADNFLNQLQDQLKSASSADNKAIPYSPATPPPAPIANSSHQDTYQKTVWRKAFHQQVKRLNKVQFSHKTKIRRQRKKPQVAHCFHHLSFEPSDNLCKNYFLRPPPNPLTPSQKFSFQVVQHRVKKLSTHCLQLEVLQGLLGGLQGWQDELKHRGVLIGDTTLLAISKNLPTHLLKYNWERTLWFWTKLERAIDLAKNREIFVSISVQKNRWDILINFYKKEQPKYVASIFF